MSIPMGQVRLIGGPYDGDYISDPGTEFVYLAGATPVDTVNYERTIVWERRLLEDGRKLWTQSGFVYSWVTKGHA